VRIDPQQHRPSARRSAQRRQWVLKAVSGLRDRFAFLIVQFVSVNAAVFINQKVADWLQALDIAQTWSRPYKQNDHPTVESKNKHVERNTPPTGVTGPPGNLACAYLGGQLRQYWRYDTTRELGLLGELWKLVSLRLNFFTVTSEPFRCDTTASMQHRRLYDKPLTAWQQVKVSGGFTAGQAAVVGERIKAVNPADLTRQFNARQAKLTELARTITIAYANARKLDTAGLEPSMKRLREPAIASHPRS
jgi:hypothetical protein